MTQDVLARLYADAARDMGTEEGETVLLSEATVRAALVRTPETPHICANHDESLDEAYRKGFADGRTPETLDVERLGKAIVEHRLKFWANEPCVANCAKDINAIYAALAPSAEPPETERTP